MLLASGLYIRAAWILLCGIKVAANKKTSVSSQPLVILQKYLGKSLGKIFAIFEACV